MSQLQRSRGHGSSGTDKRLKPAISNRDICNANGRVEPALMGPNSRSNVDHLRDPWGASQSSVANGLFSRRLDRSYRSFSSSSCIFSAYNRMILHPPRLFPPQCLPVLRPLLLHLRIPLLLASRSDSPHHLPRISLTLRYFWQRSLSTGLCPLSPFSFIVPCYFKSTCRSHSLCPSLRGHNDHSDKKTRTECNTKQHQQAEASSPEVVWPIEIQRREMATQGEIIIGEMAVRICMDVLI